MKARLFGIREIMFNNDNNEAIRGKSIYIGFEDENVTGIRTEKLFVREGIDFPKDIKLNEILDISFNMKGKVEMITKA
jgi:hypothetical protein